MFDNNLCLCAILESHIANSNLQDFNVSLTADDKSTSYIDIGEDGILKKIDRIMANLEFYESFVGSSAYFQPYRILDHSPTMLRIPMKSIKKPRPFKFYNILTHNPQFKNIVSNGLKTPVSGFWMFKVVKRLKFLKKPLRKLLYDHGNFHENVKRLRHELDEDQKALDSDPNNVEFREEEAAYLQAFNDALLMEECFLSQKAKVGWLQLGDANTAYFHKVVKSQASKNRIDSVTTLEGICVLTNDAANYMICDITHQEIRDAMFSMRDNKALGPDGYSAAFFKKAWDIIEGDVTTELMHNYHLDRGVPRCAFKVDIQKAYDTVDWTFLHDVLVGFGFHPRLIGWIMECVTSTSFFISINGSLHGYFKGKCGLRQGDPMSPYLFTLVMEVLTLMLHRRARVSNSFTYHRYCSILNIINLCFSDDLFLFAHGDVQSARVIMDSLEEFKNTSGLTPSLPKSTAYFCNVLNYVKLDVLNILPFEEDKLLVKYLGVPLVPSRLVYRDCSELGLRRLEAFNKALISSHIWSLLSLKESLWVRPLVRPFIWSRIRDGVMTSAWLDNWCSIGPLAEFISNRDIYSVGFRLNAMVCDIIVNGSRGWPSEWNVKYPVLVNTAVPHLVPIPWHAINLWLVIKRKLKTQDTLRQWDVWEHLKRFTGLSNMPSDLNSIVDFLIPLANMRSIRSVIAKLVYAASCYFIWQERNFRIFQKKKISKDQVIDIILSTVRLKLLTCRFKKTVYTQMLTHLWKLPSSLIGPSRN
ncbi:retrovirus-related pol polyprotein from transposon TNT 1-94 [Tanacetum coccineum]